MARSRYLPDSFTLSLVAVVTLASFFPVYGSWAVFFEGLTTAAIAALFFLHGAKLSREAIVAGITHWRLHLLVMACTFALFPFLGWALRPALSPLLTPELYLGVIFLCTLPATVQSAIAFTSVARGNVSAAICSASASTLLGVFITPVLVSWLVVPGLAQQLNTGGTGAAPSALDSMGRILLQLMLPFVLGHVMRRWIGKWVESHKAALKFVDQGSILLVVFTAFSAAVVEGLWASTPPAALLGLVLVCGVLLALVMMSTTFLARRFGFDKEDEITIVFCGSKKSLASGVPMAKVLFASHLVGGMVLPVMIFHQMQLMLCALIAQRYARRAVALPEAEAAKTNSQEAAAK